MTVNRVEMSETLYENDDDYVNQVAQDGNGSKRKRLRRLNKNQSDDESSHPQPHKGGDYDQEED